MSGKKQDISAQKYTRKSVKNKSKPGDKNEKNPEKPRTRKKEEWSEREARRLRNTVLDHLAYYIQVELPEMKYVSKTETSYFDIKEQDKRAVTASPKRGKKNDERKKTGRGSTDRSSNEPRGGKKVDSATQTHSSSSSSSSSDSEEDLNKRSRKEGRAKGRKKRKDNPSSREKARQEIIKSLNRSPYAVDLTRSHEVKNKSSEIMRKEAERVAVTTTKLLRSLPLSEVMEIQKYHSNAKYQLRCSSSLSIHPQGMLRSDQAVKFANQYDERKSARKYATEKKRKEKQEKKKKSRPKPDTHAYLYSKPLKLGWAESSQSSITSSSTSRESESDGSSTPRLHSSVHRKVSSSSHESSDTEVEDSNSEQESSSTGRGSQRSDVSSVACPKKQPVNKKGQPSSAPLTEEARSRERPKSSSDSSDSDSDSNLNSTEQSKEPMRNGGVGVVVVSDKQAKNQSQATMSSEGESAGNQQEINLEQDIVTSQKNTTSSPVMSLNELHAHNSLHSDTEYTQSASNEINDVSSSESEDEFDESMTSSIRRLIEESRISLSSTSSSSDTDRSSSSDEDTRETSSKSHSRGRDMTQQYSPEDHDTAQPYVESGGEKLYTLKSETASKF